MHGIAKRDQCMLERVEWVSSQHGKKLELDSLYLGQTNELFNELKVDWGS